MAKRPQKSKRQRYIVSDGKLVLELMPAGDGWYRVTSPLDPYVITQARSLPEAFHMARDAIKSLRQARAKYFKAIGQSMRAGATQPTKPR